MYSFTAKALAARVNIVNALSVPETNENYGQNWTSAKSSFSKMLTAYSDVLYISLHKNDLETRRLNLTTPVGYRYFQESLGGDIELVLDDEKNIASYSNPEGAPTEIKALVPGELVGTSDAIKPTEVTDDGILLGPMKLNEAMFVASLTVPVYNNTTIAGTTRNILGFLTVVFDIGQLVDVANNTEGLGNGQVMLLGPANRYNRMDNSTGVFNFRQDDHFKVLLPPKNTPEIALNTYPIERYPVLKKVWRSIDVDNGIDMDTRDINGKKVAIG